MVSSAVLYANGVIPRKRPEVKWTMKRMMMKKALAAGLCLSLMPLGVLAQEAVVDNGSDPQSRLNMRKSPSAEARSIGKFYSGTAVEILSDAGDGWAEVSLGGGNHSVSGYMKRAYLATGSEMDGVLDATLDMEVVSPYGTPSVVLRDAPSDSYDALAMLAVGDAVRVIGVSGEFYYVQLEDDTVGCLDSDELK